MTAEKYRKAATRPARANALERKPLGGRRCSKRGCPRLLPPSAAYHGVDRCVSHPKRKLARALKDEDRRLLGLLDENGRIKPA